MLMTKQRDRYTNWDQVPLILGTQEVANLLGVHLNTVKNWLRDGHLPAYKVGRAWKFRKDDIKALWDQESER